MTVRMYLGKTDGRDETRDGSVTFSMRGNADP